MTKKIPGKGDFCGYLKDGEFIYLELVTGFDSDKDFRYVVIVPHERIAGSTSETHGEPQAVHYCEPSWYDRAEADASDPAYWKEHTAADEYMVIDPDHSRYREAQALTVVRCMQGKVYSSDIDEVMAALNMEGTHEQS